MGRRVSNQVRGSEFANGRQHFIQADTIVPNASDPLSYDRYAYVRNNPLKYTDPTKTG